MFGWGIRYRIEFSRAFHFGYLSIGHLRRARSYLRRTWAGTDPASKSGYQAIYVHFDPEGVVHDYVVEQLRQLVAARYRITFVSNARRLQDKSVAAILPFCRQVIWRRNVGYDFGAYKDGIAAIAGLTCDRILLMNDSVYGPFRPLAEVLDSIDDSKTDFWGITDSWDCHYHIQTYFILFFKEAIASQAFRKFWRNLPYVNSKYWLVRNAEMKLTQRLTQHKLRAMALCPYWDVAKVVLGKLEVGPRDELTPVHKAFLEGLEAHLVKGQPLNPTHYFWETLITDFKCPFIKRELIQSNPARVVYAWRWAEVIGPNSRYDMGLIRRHLQAN
jgi:lipopolysaccharide biosynthesis protein